MKKVSVFTSGKINLSLNILGISGQMHLLDSVMVSIDIGDIVTASLRKDNAVNIVFEGIDHVAQSAKMNTSKHTLLVGENTICQNILSTDENTAASSILSVDQNFDAQSILLIGENNTVKKTVEYMRQRFGDFGVDIVVQKNLPIAFGLGGSAADIAATLTALSLLLKSKTKSDAEINLISAGARLGSDVPFLLKGGYVRVQGTGEVLTPIHSKLDLNIVIASSTSGCSSKDAYARFDRLNPTFIDKPTDNDALIGMLKKGETSAVNLCGNALSVAAESLCGGIEDTKRLLLQSGAISAVMTGSGSAVVGFYTTHNQAQAAAQKLKKQGLYAIACRSSTVGTKVL